MTTKTRTKVEVSATGDGPIANAIRDNADELGKRLADAMDNPAGFRTERSAFGDDLRLFDGYEIKLVKLSLAGSVDLYLSDDLHRAIVEDAKILDTAAITLTIGGHTLELLGSLDGHGVKATNDGLREHLQVKATDALGESGKPIRSDDD